MKDMFYNYDYNINVKRFPEPLVWDDGYRHSVAVAGSAAPLLNAKGEVLGLTAKRNSDFEIFFNIKDLCGDLMIKMIMESEVICNILTKDKAIVLSPTVYKYSDDTLVALVSANEDILPYGNYRIDLYAVIGGKKYTLFADTDGILSID